MHHHQRRNLFATRTAVQDSLRVSVLECVENVLYLLIIERRLHILYVSFVRDTDANMIALQSMELNGCRHYHR